MFTEDAILWSLVWVTLGGTVVILRFTVLGLIGVRVATQHSHECRHEQYNAYSEKLGRTWREFRRQMCDSMKMP